METSTKMLSYKGQLPTVNAYGSLTTVNCGSAELSFHGPLTDEVVRCWNEWVSQHES